MCSIVLVDVDTVAVAVPDAFGRLIGKRLTYEAWQRAGIAGVRGDAGVPPDHRRGESAGRWFARDRGAERLP